MSFETCVWVSLRSRSHLKVKWSKIELVRAITPIFMCGIQNNLQQVFSSRRISAILNNCLGRLKVKVTLEGQMIKWS